MNVDFPEWRERYTALEEGIMSSKQILRKRLYYVFGLCNNLRIELGKCVFT
jgi:hypothetical protein